MFYYSIGFVTGTLFLLQPVQEDRPIVGKLFYLDLRAKRVVEKTYARIIFLRLRPRCNQSYGIYNFSSLTGILIQY
jgi:hypothetical protein